jgi:predicted SAM-dependent methyltransferase
MTMSSPTTDTAPVKLEFGSGHRPSPGYLHNDVNDFDGIDIVGNPWEIDLSDATVTEVLALGVVEHFTYEQARATFRNVHRMLVPGGEFVFDVPDIAAWCRYVADHFAGRETPFPLEHLLATVYGWQRWPGDEHKSGWYDELLEKELEAAGFTTHTYGVEQFLERGLSRNRMHRPADAHIYCIARK